MDFCDANGLLISVAPTRATPNESALVDTTIDACPLSAVPRIIIGDKAYDSDMIDLGLQVTGGIRLIALNVKNRVTWHGDRRAPRRYRRRWHVERWFASFKITGRWQRDLNER